MRLSPRALRIRRLLVQSMCQGLTEGYRQVRLDDLDDGLLERCIWCGAWSIEPTCRYCCGRAVSDGDAGVLGAGHDPDDPCLGQARGRGD